MKITREVTKITHPNGSLVYRRLQKMPVGVKIKELSARIVGGETLMRQHSIRIEYNGQPIVEGAFESHLPIASTFEPPLAVPRGTAEFRVICTGFAPEEPVTAAVTVDFSFAMFG
jgi:hypothetical protein